MPISLKFIGAYIEVNDRTSEKIKVNKLILTCAKKNWFIIGPWFLLFFLLLMFVEKFIKIGSLK